MLDISLETPKDIRLGIAVKARERRLALNISQKELAVRSGVSLGSIKRFETRGLISLSFLLEIAAVLGCCQDFKPLFVAPERPASLFVPKPKKRFRSSKKVT